jgi:hypothetical protein
MIFVFESYKPKRLNTGAVAMAALDRNRRQHFSHCPHRRIIHPHGQFNQRSCLQQHWEPQSATGF